MVKENLDHYRKDNPLFTFVFQDVKAVNVTGPLTVQVLTTVPWSAFPWFLWSSARLGIMAHAQMVSPNCNTDLIGTGPFKFVSWKFGDKLVATRNPNYWEKDKDGKQLPYLDQITFVPQEDTPQRVSSLEAGDFQAIHLDAPKEIVTVRQDVKNGSLRDIESDKFAELGYVMLNATAPPFNNVNARQAFWDAIDRDTFNKLRNDGILQNASGPFAPGSQGYLANTGLPTFNPTAAKAAAAAYKTETGKDLTFTLSHTVRPGHHPGRGADPADAEAERGHHDRAQPGARPEHADQPRHRPQVRRNVVAEPPRRRRRHPVRVVALLEHPARGLRQPGELRRVQRPDHQQGPGHGPQCVERRPA